MRPLFETLASSLWFMIGNLHQASLFTVDVYFKKIMSTSFYSLLLDKDNPLANNKWISPSYFHRFVNDKLLLSLILYSNFCMERTCFSLHLQNMNFHTRPCNAFFKIYPQTSLNWSHTLLQNMFYDVSCQIVMNVMWIGILGFNKLSINVPTCSNMVSNSFQTLKEIMFFLRVYLFVASILSRDNYM